MTLATRIKLSLHLINMAAAVLHSYSTFPVHIEPASVGTRWEKYIRRLETLLVVIDMIDMDSPKRKQALLLHYAGTEVMDIYETLPELGRPRRR